MKLKNLLLKCLNILKRMDAKSKWIKSKNSAKPNYQH